MEEKYKLMILKDVLKFTSKRLSKEELRNFAKSALFQNKNYFTSAALLVKRGRITIDEMLNLGTLQEPELSLFLEPVDDAYDYFAKVTPEEILEAFKEMEDFIKNHPEEATKNRELNKERAEKIKEYYKTQSSNLSRGA